VKHRKKQTFGVTETTLQTYQLGFKIHRIARFLDPEIKAFCTAWRKHHGHY